ncbi:MAG: threonine synthase [Mangrovibacterium sp.]
MRYYSTNGIDKNVSLADAVIKGLASDKGLFMPERIRPLSPSFFNGIEKLSFQEIAFEVAKSFFGEDIPEEDLKQIVYDSLPFDCPIIEVKRNIYALELFHGPTLAFKDVGGRFMARMLAHFLKGNNQEVHVLVATSGDTGSAVANGFLGVKGIRVHVLYPKGKVSKIQEMQFVTLGQNISAIEVDGTFDDCQRLVKTAFLDSELNERLNLTSANSINVARFLPQAFYYFYAYAQLKAQIGEKSLVVAVPSGNFGNLTAGLFAKKMGLPIERFVAANNANDVVCEYLKTGKYETKSSIATIANAMDVGDPSNFARIFDLYQSYTKIIEEISGYRFSDEQIATTLKRVYQEQNYLLDPHGACAYQALEDDLQANEVGVFLETAHPAKFIETVEGIIGAGKVEIPSRLAEFMKGEKRVSEIKASFEDFKKYLLTELA